MLGIPQVQTSNPRTDNVSEPSKRKLTKRQWALSSPSALLRATLGLEEMIRTEDVDTKGGSHTCRACFGNGFLPEDDQCDSVELCPYCPSVALFAGRYQVIKQIASGHFSQVFLVRDRFHLESLRVIKLVKKGFGPLADSEAYWLRKLSLCEDAGRLALQHFYGQIQYEEQKGLVLEPLQAPELPRITRSLRELRRLILDITQLLASLHGSTLCALHADVKLENVMYSPEEERYKLIDFGNCVPVTKLDAYANDQFEIQSLHYRAPEVLVGLEIGRPADIWSLGIVLLQLLSPPTYDPPFGALRRGELLQQIAEVAGPFPDTFSEGCFAFEGLPVISSFASLEHGSFWRRWRRANLSKLVGRQLDFRLIDLVAAMLETDPRERITAEGILRHSFMAPLVPIVDRPGPHLDVDVQLEKIVDEMFTQ